MIHNSTFRDAIHLHQVVLEKVSWPDPSNVTVDPMEHLTSPHRPPGTLYPGLPLDPLEPCSQPLDPLVT